MKFVLNGDKLTIEEKESLNSGSLKYYEISVEKDTSWQELNIVAIIIKEGADKGTAIPVINNKVYVDREVNGKYFVGFKGYTVEYNLTEDTVIDTEKTYYTRSGEEGAYVYTKVENPVVGNIGTYYEETKTYQQSTNLAVINFLRGAGEIEVRNTEIPTQSEWEAYVSQIQNMVDYLEGEIPTKLSDLTNDNNTVTDASYVHTDNNYTTTEKTKLAGLSNYDDTEVRGLIAEKVDKVDGKGLSSNDFTDTYKSNVDSNTSARHTHSNKSVLDDISSTDITNWNNKADVSDIPDVSSFITKSVNDLVNYYKKTETYTQAEVNSLIGAISSLNIQIVETLPTQDISTSTIYLVPKTASTNDNYDEYIYVSNSWEHIGSTEVDLTGYATESWVNTQISSFLTQSQIESLISGAGYYTKPSGGIPSTDLSSSVQASLGKADTAIQTITSNDVTTALGYTPYNSSNPEGYTSNTGTITGITMNGTSKGTSGVVDLGTVITSHQDISGKQDVIDSSHKLSADLISDGSTNKTVTSTEKSTWSGKQDALVSGTNIKTINNESILGSGDVSIILKTILPKNSGAHNSIYRGENITDLFYNGTLSQQIAAETFDDIFVGDYIIGQTSGTKYLVADIDYRYNAGSPQTTTHHILMIPEKVMGKEKMNDTDIATGAYVGSKMYTTYLEPYRTTIQTDFGSNHILQHRNYFANSVSTGTNVYENQNNWYNSTIDLMNEIMVYGCDIKHNSTHGTNFNYSAPIDCSQLALFRFRKDLIGAQDGNGFSSVWLRDVARADTDNREYFCTIASDGHVHDAQASLSRGVRPAFLVY